jgi:hypothetical protein
MSEAYWKARYYEAERAFHELKSLTKQVPAGTWTDEYRELAGLVHSLGRDVFWVPRCWRDGNVCGTCDDCKKVERGEVR